MTGKVSDLRGKLSHVKETNKKDVAALQLKLSKVTEDSRKRITELHNDYAQVPLRIILYNDVSTICLVTGEMYHCN